MEMGTEPASKTYFFKILDKQSPRKKIVSDNFSHALFCPRFTHDDLTMQTLVWPHSLVHIDPVWRGVVHRFIQEFKMTSHI